MAIPDPGAWFLLASSNSDTFVDSKKSDLLIYTDRPDQRLFIGSINNSAMVISTSNISLNTSIIIQENVIMNSNGIFLPPTSTLNIGTFSLGSSGLIGSDIITTNNIQNGAITTNKLSNASVTASIISNSAITNEKIEPGALQTTAFSNGSVTSDKLDRTGSFFVNNMHVSPVGTNQPVYIGYSNNSITEKYAIAQTTSNETYINSGPNKSLHFAIGGQELMTLNAAGDLDITGYVTQTSDRNLKWDIQPITDGLNKVLQLNGYSYKMRENSESAGLIAQEVQHVLPQAVKTSQANKSLTLDYAAMSALYIEAFKDLSVIVKQLQEKIITLEQNQNRKMTTINERRMPL